MAELVKMSLLGLVASPCNHALPVLRRANREGWVTLRVVPCGRAMMGAGQTVEFGVFHCISDVDTATIQ